MFTNESDHFWSTEKKAVEATLTIDRSFGNAKTTRCLETQIIIFPRKGSLIFGRLSMETIKEHPSNDQQGLQVGHDHAINETCERKPFSTKLVSKAEIPCNENERAPTQVICNISIKSEDLSADNNGRRVELIPVNSTMLPNFNGMNNSALTTTARIAQIIHAENSMAQFAAKKRGRKKKQDEPLTEVINVRPFTFQTHGNAEKPAENETEVLKAAKSLFSKRTRTLYHWMYPNTPKQQLKIAVANSWETLGAQEKEFYISQVLGRFGFPQCSLMVNPQLGSIRNVPPPAALPNQSTEASSQSAEETRKAVSNILPTEDFAWPTLQPPQELPGPSGNAAAKRKLGRPPGSRNKKQKTKRENQKSNLEEGNGDEFQDDPELSREFQQFKWALHMTENTK